MWPIKLLRAAFKNVRNIGPIVSFTFHDVGFHPKHIFRRTKFYSHTEHILVLRPFEPGIIDFAEAVASTKDQVNAIATAFGFGQPMWKRFFGFVSGVCKRIESPIDMMRSKMQIEIFRLA